MRRSALANRGTRRAVVIAAGAALFAAALTLPPPAPARATEEFTAGSGSAKASLITPTVAAGNLAISILMGESTANYRDRSARGSSAIADVPLFRVSSSTRVCGQTGRGTGSYLPPPITADTASNNDTEPVAADQPTNDQVVVQSARAEPEAKSSAVTRLGTAGLAPLVQVSGAVATADIAADAASLTRTASAHSAIDEIVVLDGLVRFSGLRWDVEQQVVGLDDRNDEESAGAVFDMTAITVGVPGLEGLNDVSIPVTAREELPAAVDQANGLLAPLGVQIRLPQVIDNPEARSHTVTPLTVAIGGKDWLLAPVFATVLQHPAFRELSRTVTDTLFDPAECKQLAGLMQALPDDVNTSWNSLGSAAPLLLAVAAGALGGTGEIQLNLGGASTAIENTYYEPLGFGPPLLGAPRPLTPTVAGTPGSPGAPGAPATPGVPEAAAPVADAVATAPAGQAVATAAVSTTCRTTSPVGRPGCWVGRGPAGAIAAALFTVGLLAVDEAMRRRKRGVDVGAGT